MSTEDEKAVIEATARRTRTQRLLMHRIQDQSQ
jgi:hypothetical protein